MGISLLLTVWAEKQLYAAGYARLSCWKDILRQARFFLQTDHQQGGYWALLALVIGVMLS